MQYGLGIGLLARAVDSTMCWLQAYISSPNMLQLTWQEQQIHFTDEERVGANGMSHLLRLQACECAAVLESLEEWWSKAFQAATSWHSVLQQQRDKDSI